MINLKDREILRALAARNAEIAALPEMSEKKKLWYDHNQLKTTRPLVLSLPEGAWVELVRDNDLQCEGELARRWEFNLRQTIYQHEVIGDDTVVESVFNVPFKITSTGFGVDSKKHHGENRGSYSWEPPIKNLEHDFSKLCFRQFASLHEESAKELELAKELFNGMLTVKQQGIYWWSLGLTWGAIDLIGLENLMFYMYDEPENLHHFMKWLSDEHMNMIMWFEKEGILTLNNANNHVGSGGFGYTTELPSVGYKNGDPARLKDLWGFAESQETVGISPDMFAEFVFPYQLPLLEKFGLNCYGCCEAVDLKWKYIKTIPNLRRVSVSPWSNQEVMAENLGNNYIFSRKPNPSLVCTDFNEDVIRKDIQNTLNIAKDCILELILKDTHTVQNQPERLSKWVKMAYKEIGM